MYALVENNQITNVVESLPVSWKHISGLNLITDNLALKNLGWYEVILDEPNYDLETETISGYEYVYNAETDSAHRVAIISPIYIPTEEELAQQLLQRRQRMICTNYQARVALVQFDLYDVVEAAMASPEIDPLAKIAWQHASNFYRISPFVAAIGSSLGLTDEQLDELFEQAMEIDV